MPSTQIANASAQASMAPESIEENSRSTTCCFCKGYARQNSSDKDPKSLSKHQRADLRRGCSHGHADSDFGRAAGHVKRQQAVKAECRQHFRQKSKGAGQPRE